MMPLTMQRPVGSSSTSSPKSEKKNYTLLKAESRVWYNTLRKDKTRQQRQQAEKTMRKLLLSISKITALEVPLSPILLCGAVASSNVSTYYHNLMVLTVACAIISFVTFLAAQVMD